MCLFGAHNHSSAIRPHVAATVISTASERLRAAGVIFSFKRVDFVKEAFNLKPDASVIVIDKGMGTVEAKVKEFSPYHWEQDVLLML